LEIGLAGFSARRKEMPLRKETGPPDAGRAAAAFGALIRARRPADPPRPLRDDATTPAAFARLPYSSGTTWLIEDRQNGSEAGGMRKAAMIRGAAAALALAPGALAAGDLTYEPVNPSFGGDPFNSSHLLGIAQAQNEFDDRSFEPVDPIDRFADDIERRVLSQAAREITDRIFGENPQDSGDFTVGTNRIAFEQVGDEVRLTLTDIETGGETVLTIPAPRF
jgi:curli production assembly/transport component CsgF